MTPVAGLRFRKPAVLTVGLLASCVNPQPGFQPQAVKHPPPAAPSAGIRRGRITSIELSGLFALQQNDRAVIFDVRPSFVHAFGHLPGAVNWPRASFLADLPAHEERLRAARTSGKTVVLYCTDRDCPDSRTAAELLSGKGWPVSVFEGGYHAWKDAGMPVE